MIAFYFAFVHSYCTKFVLRQKIIEYLQDAIVSDDFMGEAHLHIDTFSPDDSYRVDLLLEDAGDPLLVKKKKKKSLGSIEVEFSLDFISQSQFNHVSSIESVN